MPCPERRASPHRAERLTLAAFSARTLAPSKKILALAQALGVDCNASTLKPADATPAPRGRPRKGTAADAPGAAPAPGEGAQQQEGKAKGKRRKGDKGE